MSGGSDAALGSGEAHRRRIVEALLDQSTSAGLDEPAKLVTEALEIAGVEAERLVAMHPRTAMRLAIGMSSVVLSFSDAALLAAFRDVDAIRPATRVGWRLVRRWADPGSDASLDRAMCLSITRTLNRIFGWRLGARAQADRGW